MYEDKDNPNGKHFYGFFYDRRHRKYNAIQLTHISRIDQKRYNQVERGLIAPARINKLNKYADSGITRARYISDINGNPLHPSMGEIVIEKVSPSIENKIKNHGNVLYEKGKKKKTR